MAESEPADAQHGQIAQRVELDRRAHNLEQPRHDRDLDSDPRRAPHKVERPVGVLVSGDEDHAINAQRAHGGFELLERQLVLARLAVLLERQVTRHLHPRARVVAERLRHLGSRVGITDDQSALRQRRGTRERARSGARHDQAAARRGPQHDHARATQVQVRAGDETHRRPSEREHR